jgi:hypothetical protein
VIAAEVMTARPTSGIWSRCRFSFVELVGDRIASRIS